MKNFLSQNYLKKLKKLGLNLDSFEEKHIQGGGKGGQKVNKTSNCVQLSYKPLNLVLKCQEQRDLHRNRKIAYQRMIDLIELKTQGRNSKIGQKIAKIQRRKSKKTQQSSTKKQQFLILLSPSKTQDFSQDYPEMDFSTPDFLLETQKLVHKLKNFQVQQIQELMGVSPKIAQLNFERFQKFSPSFSSQNSKPALFAFQGDVYRSFDLATYNQNDLLYANQHLRIISGLYGLLRPLDLIQAYRLEMKTSLSIEQAANLYHFWGEKLGRKIQDAKPDYIIDLASLEYSQALNLPKLNIAVIKPKFLKKQADNSLKNIAIYAKKARGAMADFIIQERIEDLASLQKFNWNSYSYQADSSPEEPTFVC